MKFFSTETHHITPTTTITSLATRIIMHDAASPALNALHSNMHYVCLHVNNMIIHTLPDRRWKLGCFCFLIAYITVSLSVMITGSNIHRDRNFASLLPCGESVSIYPSVRHIELGVWTRWLVMLSCVTCHLALGSRLFLAGVL